MRSTVLTSLVLTAMLPAGARAQVPPPPPVSGPPVVVTTGEGIVRVVPDRAFVAIAAESRAKTPTEAQRVNAQAMSAVHQTLREAGVPPEAVRTLAYDLQPEFDYVNGRRIPRGYVARNRIELRVDDLQELGRMIDLAVTTGATSVDSVRFDLKDRPAVERKALELAVADARARAESAAAGAGQAIQRILRIAEERVGRVPPPWPGPMRAAAIEVADAVQPPIEAGELEIRSQVVLTAELR